MDRRVRRLPNLIARYSQRYGITEWSLLERQGYHGKLPKRGARQTSDIPAYSLYPGMPGEGGGGGGHGLVGTRNYSLDDHTWGIVIAPPPLVYLSWADLPLSHSAYRKAGMAWEEREHTCNSSFRFNGGPVAPNTWLGPT